MSRDRSEAMSPRSGLLGWVDKIRYKEIYRQTLGLLLVAVCAWQVLPGSDRLIWGLSVAVAGQIFRIFAAGTIFKNRKLATQGAYALVRHPLYLGNILILGGFVWASGSWVMAAVVLAFFLIWYPAAVRYEDAKLERLFEDDWRNWSRGTWAVLPLRPRFGDVFKTSWSAHQSMLRNGELYITVYLGLCAAWMWMAVGAGPAG